MSDSELTSAPASAAEPTGSTSVQPARPRSPYRELASVAALIVLAAGAIVLLTSLRWVELTASRAAPFPPVRRAIKGHTEFPALTGLAIVALLIAILTFVTGRWSRRVLGTLLCGVGVWSLSYGIRGSRLPSPERQLDLLGHPGGAGVVRGQVSHGPPLLAVLFAVLLLLAGIVLVLRSGGWTGGLSARYSAPAEARKGEDPWRILDRGGDPTLGDS